MKLDDLPTPALVLDLDRAERNLARMAARCRQLGVALRPHIKTHKCLELAERQLALGASGITVSTLYEAELFARHRFRDITWAFPLIPSRVAQAEQLRLQLGLLVDSEEAVSLLERSGYPFKVWLAVNCGYRREGVNPRGRLSLELARRLSSSPVLRFTGVLSHSGQAYSVTRSSELVRVAAQERRVMVELAGRLRKARIEVPAVSVGSTPAPSRVRRLDGVTEARPGNYVFYDHTQVVLGSCKLEDCALTVLDPKAGAQGPNLRRLPAQPPGPFPPPDLFASGAWRTERPPSGGNSGPDPPQSLLSRRRLFRAILRSPGRRDRGPVENLAGEVRRLGPGRKTISAGIPLYPRSW